MQPEAVEILTRLSPTRFFATFRYRPSTPASHASATHSPLADFLTTCEILTLKKCARKQVYSQVSNPDITSSMTLYRQSDRRISFDFFFGLFQHVLLNPEITGSVSPHSPQQIDFRVFLRGDQQLLK